MELVVRRNGYFQAFSFFRVVDFLDFAFAESPIDIVGVSECCRIVNELVRLALKLPLIKELTASTTLKPGSGTDHSS